MVLTTKTISQKLWLYERPTKGQNAISIGKAKEVLELIVLNKDRNWRDKSIFVQILDIQGKFNMANFFRRKPRDILDLIDAIDFEDKLEDLI